MQWSIAAGILIIAMNVLTEFEFESSPNILKVASLPLLSVGVLELTLAIITRMPVAHPVTR